MRTVCLCQQHQVLEADCAISVYVAKYLYLDCPVRQYVVCNIDFGERWRNFCGNRVRACFERQSEHQSETFWFVYLSSAGFSQSSYFFFFNSALFRCRNLYTVPCILPLISISIASLAI